MTRLAIILTVCGLLTTGCGAPKIHLFQDATVPLQESIIQGEGYGKVLVIPVKGFIADKPPKGLFSPKPSMVQEIVSQLRLAEKDPKIKAVLLRVDSPGGSTTGSDILYHEINAFKKRTGVKVVAVMMGVAASGGYYVCLPADVIWAHPTTVTGSIGVIFMEPKVTALMEKIGVDVEVSKSGENKDMGSPFRGSTEREKKIFAGIIDALGKRFIDLTKKHRNLDEAALAKVSTAQVFLSSEALELGLVDEIGYLSDALSQAKRLGGLQEDAKVVAYRRSEYPDDNLYNTSTAQYRSFGLSLVDLGLPFSGLPQSTGFYYLWSPAARGH